MKGSFYITLYALLGALVLSQQDFEEISNVPQDVDSVYLSPDCSKRGKHARAMFTFEPSTSDRITVSTYPPDLVTAIGSNNELRFLWNPDVAYKEKEGGVKIGLPPNKVSYLSIAADTRAQILYGLTGLKHIDVSSDASLYANLTSLGNSSTDELVSEEGFVLTVHSDAFAIVAVDILVSRLEVTSDARLELQAPIVKSLKVSSDAHLSLLGSANHSEVTSDATMTIDGDLQDARISSDAKVTVYGKVTGEVTVSSDGKLSVGEEISESASVEASSDGRVNAPTCDKVSTKSDAKCSVDTSISGEVIIDIPIRDFTRTGTERCTGIFLEWWHWVLVACAFIPCAIWQLRVTYVSRASGWYTDSPVRTAEVVAVAYPVEEKVLVDGEKVPKGNGMV